MKYKGAIYALFFGTGISGLIYEVVWLRMLSRITGVTLYATATVLTAFMAGLALGSFVLGRVVDKREDNLRLYAVLELLAACTALLVPVLFAASVPIYQYVYEATGGNAVAVAVVRGLLTFLTLLIPTTMMGGTLPVLTACLVKRDCLFGKNFSLLYGINTLGAVMGVLLSGFVTIGAVGEIATLGLGATINLFVATTAYLIYRVDRRSAPADRAVQAGPNLAGSRPISPYSDRVRTVVLVVFAISGLTALAYEVIWTRQLILFLYTSIYAFSAMLAVFLSGIALGSMSMSGRLDRLKRPLVFFAFLELIVGLLSVANLYLFSPLDSSALRNFAPQGPLGLLGLLLPLLSTVVLVFPITFVFGMIFPVAGLCFAKEIGRTGSSVGSLYGANTIGGVLGSLLAGFLLVPAMGSTNTVILLACLNVVLGLIVLRLASGTPLVWKSACFVLVLGFLAMVAGAMGKDPFLSTIEKRVFSGAANEPSSVKTEIYLNKEGLEGTVTAFTAHGRKQLWINGVGMTTLSTETKLMAHLPLAFAAHAKEMLVICFGMGTTVRSAALYPDLNITAVDLVPETFEAFSYYHADAEKIKKNARVRLVRNDGRNTLLLSSKKYDVITVDPAPPLWMPAR